MPACHHCPHDGARSAACLTCRGTHPFQYGGRNLVRYHDNTEAEVAGSLRASHHAEPAADEPDQLDLCRILLAHLTELADDDLIYLMDRLRGLTYRESSARHGIAYNTIHLHLKKASAEIPWLARFTGMKTIQRKKGIAQ